jgi:hypothetical protein
VVDVLDWLTDRGALRLSDGSAETWAHDSERGDALYDIDHDVCSSLFRPARPIQQLGGAAGLLEVPDISSRRSAQREASARRARRMLVENPVVYYASLDAEAGAALRGTELADNLARLTGLVVERRAEGVMLVDPTGRFTDQPCPGRGGAVNRTAGLLLAKIADILEDPIDGPALTPIPVPSTADDLRDLLKRINTRMKDPDEANWAGTADADPLVVPFIDRTRMERMLDELYDLFGPASFTAQWQSDRTGLLDAAVRLLDDLRLVRRMPGGAALLPAAARYRNITAALPEGARRGGQGMFDFSEPMTEGVE